MIEKRRKINIPFQIQTHTITKKNYFFGWKPKIVQKLNNRREREKSKRWAFMPYIVLLLLLLLLFSVNSIHCFGVVTTSVLAPPWFYFDNIALIHCWCWLWLFSFLFHFFFHFTQFSWATCCYLMNISHLVSAYMTRLRTKGIAQIQQKYLLDYAMRFIVWSLPTDRKKNYTFTLIVFCLWTKTTRNGWS